MTRIRPSLFTSVPDLGNNHFHGYGNSQNGPSNGSETVSNHAEDRQGIEKMSHRYETNIFFPSQPINGSMNHHEDSTKLQRTLNAALIDDGGARLNEIPTLDR